MESVTSPSSPTTDPVSPLSAEEKEAAELAEDKQAVQDEWDKYMADGVIEKCEELDDFDLERFWMTHKRTYPLFFRVALDVMPAQASSVPCERVFSSSKETDTIRRSQLSPVMMEILQMLKFMFRSERLDFNDNWVSREQDMVVADINPSVLEDMIAWRDISELDRLLAGSS
ncbi:putative hAT family C-terminal dimerisation region [Lyophyllum shimeji]|uniref:HAT family C-terminal dimerisation region n=1 Tax=Lyophyllum shimeji TaxID=47721 RepID=A0A9P3Q1U6_LYOSH|nr:putative hAT family C-terminal dimerisation region [Lyophyllum shimeji]